ncbi:DeoR/GlpR family DNA-binding transcription regulator [Ascidiimonas aurantiaca]|uniref:DeoR/GlpR family DNA-binding transcription regulator n=1 Tax=Ascidiimonas aurantiaca TaxID=1685432 RepID=UPI0030EC8EA9
MLKEERHQIILNEVHIHNRVLLPDIAEILNVSVDTVRRDVKELDAKKKLKKVHGGAVSLGFNIYNYREQDIYLHKKKSAIAEKAVKLLKEGNVVLISGGTTNLELARMIPPKLNLTFFTPSLPVAMQLLSQPNAEVIFLGGKLSKEAQIAVGGNVINTLSDIKTDICFLGTGYLDPVHGLTEFDWEVVQIKKAMIKAARRTVLLTISDKLHSVQRYKTCDLHAIDTLVTELEPDSEALLPFKNNTIHFL